MQTEIFFKARELIGRELPRLNTVGWEGLYLTQESFKTLYDFLKTHQIESCEQLYLFVKPRNPGFALHNEVPVKKDQWEDEGKTQVSYNWQRDSEISESCDFRGSLDEMVRQLDPQLLNAQPLLEHDSEYDDPIRVYRIR